LAQQQLDPQSKNLQPHLMMTRPQLKRPSPAQLEELIDEATIDCFGEDEEHTGLLTMIEEYVVCPFRAKSPAFAGPTPVTVCLPFASAKERHIR
jgi:hypothetical protein